MSLYRPLVPFICSSCRHALARGPARGPTLTSKRFKQKQSVALVKHNYLPSSRPVRTRFAPSPTGYLHLGSLRTALFNYLLAKRTGGQFLLRVEDTDQKRTVPDAEQRLFEDLRWTGIQWDEGPEVGGPHGPYRQSERIELYSAEAEKLREAGHAYRCFCSAEKLHYMAAQREALGLPSSYDRSCATLSAAESDERAANGEAYVLRFRAPHGNRSVAWEDLIYGKIKDQGKGTAEAKQNAGYAFDDFVLMKTDGWPTYHLANVVDDHHMNITHVVRGTEWMISTPKHLALYNAFQWTPPEFAHVGLLLDADGSKLSKRRGDLSIQAFRDRGILPEALVNFVALLGWSGCGEHGQFLTMSELEKSFNMKWPRSNPIVDMTKLEFLQKRHAIAGLDADPALADGIIDGMLEAVRGLDGDADEWAYILDGRDEKRYLRDILKADAKNYTTPAAFVAGASYYFRNVPVERDVVAKVLAGSPPDIKTVLADLRYRLEELPVAEWSGAELKSLLDGTVDEYAAHSDASGEGVAGQRAATKAVYQCLRSALTNGGHGAPLCDTMAILGKSVCVERLKDWLYFAEDVRPGLDFVLE